MTEKTKNKSLKVLSYASNAKKRNVYMVTVCLLLRLLPGSHISLGAMPSTAWKKNAKVGIELRRGFPYGTLLKEDKEFKADLEDLKINSNWQFGAVGGYSFPYCGNTLAIGPEVGLLIGAKNKVEFSEFDRKFSVQERYLYIPIALKLTAFKQKTGVQESGLMLGYELRVLLSSQLRQVGGPSDTGIQSGLKDFENTAKSIKRGSSIFLEGRVGIFKGCYLTGKLKLPATDASAFHKANQENDNKRKHIHGIRMLSESFIELGLGVNIMKWFLSDT